MPLPENILYFGDNKDVLPQIPDESVDLVYIDPPFNSARQYNLLFKQMKGDPSPAQIMAFEDTWAWSPSLMEDFILDCEHPRLRRLVDSLYDVLGTSEMMAYVLMMSPRLLALSRKLKGSESIFLHCDPVASHYLKIVLDVIFGPENFRNEIIWQRTGAKSLATVRFPRNHDVLLSYTRTEKATWNSEALFTRYDEDNLDPKSAEKYCLKDSDGRRYQLTSLINPNNLRPNLTYEFLGVTKVWRWTRERMQQAYDRGEVVQNRPGAVPRFKRYLDDQRGRPIGDVWTDIAPVNAMGKERRGYPTQKPVALLERILSVATTEGDTVLDAFCGCGTTIAAAQRLLRRWIGIDVTYLAVREIEDRLGQDFMLEKGVDYRVEGLPADLDSARQFFELTRKDSHKQFEMWAVSLIGGQPRAKRGSDRGIDGDFLLHGPDRKPIIAPLQVKGGEHAGSGAIRDFAHVIGREKAPTGGFICLKEPSSEMRREAATLGMMEVEGRRVPRMQILPIGDILEHGATFKTPDGYTRPPSRYRMQGNLGF